MYTFNCSDKQFNSADDPSESVIATTHQAYRLVKSGELNEDEFEKWIDDLRDQSFNSGYSASIRDDQFYD